MKTQQWSVKALVAYLKMGLDNNNLIQNIMVVGELSNFNHHHTHHMYFTLKDEASKISCVMFASNSRKVNFKPEDGMQVIVKASVSIFEASGSLQLYVKEMVPYGIGNLALKFEQLKTQLNNEGLFDEKHKKQIPLYPMKIAIVTGQDSAALSDIKTTLKRRWPIAKTKIYNTLVQGNKAHFDIINNLKEADNNDFDLIILARGGGSIEDLWAFNEELLAREIFNLNTPIISGIGHEVDFTIADFVSDLRAPTPTAAAEMATPDIAEVKLNISNINLSLKETMFNLLNNQMLLVDSFRKSTNFTYPEKITNVYKESLNVYKTNLSQWKNYQLRKINLYNNLTNNFKNKTQTFIYNERINLNTINNNLLNFIKFTKNNTKNKFIQQVKLIDSYSPLNTLKRGYSIVELNNSIINSISLLEKNDNITIKMQDGKIMAKVLETRLNNE